MDLEYYWYELSPFIYTVAGGFFLGRADSFLPVASALLLLTAGGTILFLRRTYALRMRLLRDTGSRDRLPVRPTPAKG